MSYECILDSSAWVSYLGGTNDDERLKQIIENEAIATSIIAIAELADKFEREKRSFDAPLQFIRNRSVFLPLTLLICLKAAKLKNEIRAKNKKFGIVDGIHLATAINEKEILITTDHDFEGVDNVLII